MAWQKVATITLGLDGKQLLLPSFVPKTFLQLLVHNPIGTLIAGQTANLEFNGDDTANYRYRRSSNGGADTTPAATAFIPLTTSAGDNDGFSISYEINISDKEKLGLHWVVNSNATGPANTPNRAETVSKWVNTSAQIIDSEINSTGDDYATSSNYSVLGTD